MRLADLFGKLRGRNRQIADCGDTPVVPAPEGMSRYRFVREYHRDSAAPVDFALEAALWRVGWADVEDLEDAATRMLIEGHDEPAIVQMAACLADRYSLGGVLDEALRELGLAPLTDSDAGSIVARHIAEEILSGRLSPDDGVSLFQKLYLDLEYPDWLTVFFCLEDDLCEVQYRSGVTADSIRGEIIAKARELLASTSGGN